MENEQKKPITIAAAVQELQTEVDALTEIQTVMHKSQKMLDERMEILKANLTTLLEAYVAENHNSISTLN